MRINKARDIQSLPVKQFEVLLKDLNTSTKFWKMEKYNMVLCKKTQWHNIVNVFKMNLLILSH